MVATRVVLGWFFVILVFFFRRYIQSRIGEEDWSYSYPEASSPVHATPVTVKTEA